MLRFALHFLAFFDFNPSSLCEQRSVVDTWVAGNNGKNYDSDSTEALGGRRSGDKRAAL